MPGTSRCWDVLAAGVAESLAGIRTIAAAGSAHREEQRVLAPLSELREHGEQMWRVVSRSTAQAALAGPLVLVAVLAVAGMALSAGRISAGELVAASRYATLGIGLGGLTGALGRLARSRAGRRRIEDVLAVQPPRYGRRGLPAQRGSVVGRLELRRVTVHDEGAVLLDEIDLDLPGGTLVAVVGRNGAGKSTLAAVAARLRDPASGEVLLDGVPLRELSHDALRRAVGPAFERPVLLGRTVGEAIGPGRDPAAVLAAASAMQAHGVVARLPSGYDTPLADAPLSGGEEQRLGLARAWPADRLVVLDDATSNLDMITEARIGDTLEHDRAGRTVLVVTHRAAVAARCDLVVWLENGRVRAQGAHLVLCHDPDYQAAFG